MGSLAAVLREAQPDAPDAIANFEELLHCILECLPVGVWVTDSKGCIRYGNKAGQRVWGGAKYVCVNDYGEYKGWWHATGKRIEAQEWALARALKGEAAVGEIVDIEAFDGTRKTIINSAVPLRNPAGAIVGAMVVNEDISAMKAAESERERLVRDLEAALSKVKLLSGLLPICASCKKIRQEDGTWRQIESYIRDHSLAQFSHGLCPECLTTFDAGCDGSR